MYIKNKEMERSIQGFILQTCFPVVFDCLTVSSLVSADHQLFDAARPVGRKDLKMDDQDFAYNFHFSINL